MSPDAARPTHEPTSTEEWERYRLPRHSRPVRYDLELRPDLGQATFSGTAAIEVEVLEATNTLVCNAADLEIHRVWIEGSDGGHIEPELVALDPATERLTVEAAAVLDPGHWTLHLAFDGILNERLAGFYRSTFRGPDGTAHTIATTQFEATDARRAFPCWDEPDFKATFAVTLVVDPSHVAISNAAEIGREERPDGSVAVSFADTMVMSTYLVAFVVGPLEITEADDGGEVPLRVVHPPGQGHLATYALGVARFCLDYFSEYYDLPYPGDKLDLVAVPDFAFGAMENLGCITFREVLILVDPDEVTQQELANVTDVIAHELAHMWFGDLVTMRWWNGIWLNEAFATFMEMKATDAFRPDWDRWAAFGTSRSAAFDTDALSATRPIEYPVVSPDDAEGMFDVLTYEKGAAVVRMLEQYLGPDEFRDGIRHYLRTHAWSNTETADLWEALEATTGAPVRRIAESWIYQGGHPVVTVDVVDDGATLRLGQRRATYAGDLGDGDAAAEDARDDARWVIPVIFTQSGGGATTFEKALVEGDGVDVPLLDEPLEWVLVNTEATGFYRAAYAPALREALVARAHEELSAVERYTLVDDAWASVLAGRSTALEALELVMRFGPERDLAVWQRIVAVLRDLDRMIEAADARQAFAAMVSRLIQGARDDLGNAPVVGEADRTSALRGLLFSTAGTLGAEPAVQARARDLLQRPGADAALAAAAVEVVAHSGGSEDYEQFLRRRADARTPQEERRYLFALCEFDDPELMDQTLAACLDGSIRSQDAPYVIRRALTNRTQGRRAWAFVQSQWAQITERYPSNSIARMLEGIRWLAWPDVANLVFAFFETHEVPQGDRLVAQHLEKLEVNLALAARDAEALTDHLRRE
ncbi:MAG: M1 family metallopeptidase [Acidimicrobiia bacterium]|nr:M1 family metallopeptidase [Acidimicrobiia bacterium]